MKKLLAILLILAMSAVALASCESTPVPTVKDITMNEDGSLNVNFTDGTTIKTDVPEGMTTGGASVGDAEFSFDAEGNLVVTYPDGTAESLGKDAIKEYTVTFVDYDGASIGTATALAGRGVTAPADPTREDYIFAGWDKAFDSVTENMIVTATYTPMATYTVTFVDHDGTVLKSAMVVSGKDATPPADPTREGYNFKGWQGDYTAITKDTEITAEYTEKSNYTVTFVDFNGLVLKEVTVKEGESATAPASPTREGFTFTGWSSSLSNITENKTVKAQYKLIAKPNTLVVDYTLSGSTVTLTLALDGNVCVAGMQGTLSFEGMTATAVKADSALAFPNLKADGTVVFAYSSPTNVTKGEKLLTVTLTKTADTGKVNLILAKCVDQSNVSVDYTVVGQTIKLK